MRYPAAMRFALCAFAVFAAARAETAAVPIPAALEVARGVWLVPGGIRPDRQPDGNTVVFEAPAGLVVVDTGRHRWHREGILSLARAQEEPIVAIVNTHWHLDHVSGNAGLRAAYPALQVYATDAIEGALAGFLAKSAEESAKYLEDPQIPETIREDIRGDVTTIESDAALKPDVVVGQSGTMDLGGRRIQVHRVADAVTAGDLWLYDEGTRVLVLGDLVTLPAPFLDTACPAGWQAALRSVSDLPFEVAIPGHGLPMNRSQLELYRGAFETFIGCTGSTRPAAECATQWADSVAPLLEDAAAERPRAQRLAEYYVGMLRGNGGRSEHCAAADGGN